MFENLSLLANSDTNKSPTLLVIAGCAGAGKSTLGREIASRNHWVYIDKDTLTMDMSDFILDELGKNMKPRRQPSDKEYVGKGDRESETYVTKIKPLEYRTCFKACVDNLSCDNSVVLVIPFVNQLCDINEWDKLKLLFPILRSVNSKFVWIQHKGGAKERQNLLQRKSERDSWKLTHWRDYLQTLTDIDSKIDPNYHPFMFDNTAPFDTEVAKVLNWLEI